MQRQNTFEENQEEFINFRNKVNARKALKDQYEFVAEDWCKYCQKTIIKVPGEPVNNPSYELSCQHRFCYACINGFFWSWIESAAIDNFKCFDRECQRPIEPAKLNQIFEQKVPRMGQRYHFLKNSWALESDLLVRQCTKAGCEAHIRAENDEVKKLDCPTCDTQVCFNCRKTWHGENVSCTKAVGKDFQQWKDEN